MSVAICYVDEAGCTGMLPTATSEIQPIFALSALIIDQSHIHKMTKDFIALKMKYFPSKFANLRHDLDAMKIEIKGADVKKNLRGKNNGSRKIAEKFMDELLSLIESIDGRIISRIWIKGIAVAFNGVSVYSSSMQDIAKIFDDYLHSSTSLGFMIGDFRDHVTNSIMSHSIFTQKYKRGHKGDAYPSLVEAPVFGISDNHAGLQIIDLITSALIYPMASHVYCSGYVNNNHVVARNRVIHDRYRKRVKALQYFNWKGSQGVYGVNVYDALKPQRRKVNLLWA